MAYFNKYYIEFTDTNVYSPSTYRVDIMDSEGGVPTEPFRLTPGSIPLIGERTQVTEDKDYAIVGREITISYEYTGAINEPLPAEFFDSQERRFRVEIRKNNILTGVFYVRPDFGKHPHSAPPFTVEIKAVDGLTFAKGVNFNIYDDTGLLIYDRLSWYEVLVKRSLYQIFDAGTPVNLINTLKPVELQDFGNLLFNSYIHTEITYDFIEGPKKIHDVLILFLKSFKAKLFVEDNQIWIVRTQDLTGDSIEVETYLDETTVNVSTPDLIATVGPLSSNDATIINLSGNNLLYPANKSVSYSADYIAINRAANFDWRSFGDFGVGLQFQFWFRVEGNQQYGTGTIADPYRAFLPFNPGNPGGESLTHNMPNPGVPPGPALYGDVLQIAFRWRVSNVDQFRIRVRIESSNPGNRASLTSGGAWVENTASYIDFKRNRKKRNGSFEIKTDPIPSNIAGFGPSAFNVWIDIFTPTGLNSLDGDIPAGLEIYPIKLAISANSSLSIVTKGTNTDNYTNVREKDDFVLFDADDLFNANTVSINTGGGQQPVTNWVSKINDQQSLAYFMTRALIDQYARTVHSLSATVQSSFLNFVKLIECTYIPGRRFVQVSCTENYKDCEQEIVAIEVLPENGSNFEYDIYDINEETD